MGLLFKTISKRTLPKNDKVLFNYFFETLKRLTARRKETSARFNSLSSWFSLALAIRASARLRARSAREVSISSFLSAADATTDKTLFENSMNPPLTATSSKVSSPVLTLI